MKHEEARPLLTRTRSTQLITGIVRALWSDIFLSYHNIRSCQAAHIPPALEAEIKREIEGPNAKQVKQ